MTDDEKIKLYALTLRVEECERKVVSMIDAYFDKNGVEKGADDLCFIYDNFENIAAIIPELKLRFGTLVNLCKDFKNEQ